MPTCVASLTSRPIRFCPVVYTVDRAGLKSLSELESIKLLDLRYADFESTSDFLRIANLEVLLFASGSDPEVFRGENLKTFVFDDDNKGGLVPLLLSN